MESLHSLQTAVTLPCNARRDLSPESLDVLLYCKLSYELTSITQPVKITHCLMIQKDFTWSLSVNRQYLDLSKCHALKSLPSTLNHSSLAESILRTLDTLVYCTGHHDSHFVSIVLAKIEKILSDDGKIVAFVDD